MLKTLLIPGTKIVIVGAAFRQSKVIFEYMESIWQNSPLLRDICSSNSGPRRETDRCTMRINDSWTIAVPLGDGSKIRGLRAHTIIADEFNCLDKNTLVETTNGLIRIGDETEFDNIGRLITGDFECSHEFPTKFIKTRPTEVFEVVLENGYNIKCSLNHQVMTNNGWKKPLELNTEDYIECNNYYQFPSKEVEGLDKDTAWLMGILTSEGSINDKSRIGIKTTDFSLAQYICNKFGFTMRIRPAYLDDRGWECKESYELYKNDINLRNKLYSFGLDYCCAIDKVIPKGILKSPRHIVVSYLEGLFEGDGSCFQYKSGKINNRLGVAYYSVSEQLCRDVQVVLLKLGFDGYINNRYSKLSGNLQWFVRFNGTDAYDLANLFNIDRFKTSLQNCYIPKQKTNLTWDKGRNKWKVQIKHLGKTIQKRFHNKQDAVDYISFIKRNQFKKVKFVRGLPEKQELYDYYLPITHSFYAGGFRQHNSIPPSIFETVVAGFTAVSANPIKNVQEAARRKAMKKAGIWTKKHEQLYREKSGNQAILSGTAGYAFQHFSDYWRKYYTFIHSRGELDRRVVLPGGEVTSLRNYFDDEADLDSFDYRDYSILRIPYEKIPEGFMDDKQVMRAKATVHSGVYATEYGAVFTEDSEGFFRRSLIESCVATDLRPIKLPSGEVWFDAKVRGDTNKGYVYGIDPASERDNFSIVILEINPDHNRIVYCWSTNKKDFQARQKAGLTQEDDYYSFCVRKVRDLMKVFPCIQIGIDSQGGGFAIEEGLHDKDKMEENEQQLWQIIDPEKEKPTDDKPGLHILEMINFADAKWTSAANHGMRKDMEDKVLLFPRFDPLTLELSPAVQNDQGISMYDSVEDCVIEIEELKNELSTIIMTMTGTGVGGRERWDTPEVQNTEGKKERLRKDRYSALVIANMIARQIRRADPAAQYGLIGGFSKDFNKLSAKEKKKIKNQGMYTGADWIVQAGNLPFGRVNR